MTHNYFPTSEFYVKTLVTKTYTEDGSSTPNSSIFSNRTTNTDQLSSFFYWRPGYKPYSMTGGLRTYRRVSDLQNTTDTEQIGVDANVVALSGIAIAIGVMVDVGVVFTENIVRHLEMPENKGAIGKKLLTVIYEGTTEVASAVITALLQRL